MQKSIIKNKVKRILVNRDPFLPKCTKKWQEKGFWPASWISFPEALQKPFVTAYMLEFNLTSHSMFNIHITADERYELFLDGERVGRGSERGDLNNWFFETYQLNLDSGKHLIVAKVWSLGDKAPMSQMSVESGFLLAAEGTFRELLSTGIANWQVMQLKGYSFTIPSATFWRGARISLDANHFSWNFEQGSGDWRTAKKGKHAVGKVIGYTWHRVHRLVPATLPPMLEKEITTARARYAGIIHASESGPEKLTPQKNSQSDLANWKSLLNHNQDLVIQAHSIQRVIIDMNDYYCLFPIVFFSKGKGARVQIHSAESLYVDTYFTKKGHRGNIENKYFSGVGDEFISDGGKLRRIDLLQFQAGRYWQLRIQTQGEELIIKSLKFIETRYPLENQASFESSNQKLNRLLPIMTRTLELSSHETLADAPYYEDMMYAGDTRLELLATYQFCHDDKLARKAIKLFDSSRLANGMIQARYPSWVTQVIAPFSIWWIAMLHDYAYWRNPEYIKQFLPGMRATLEGFERFKNTFGLLENVEGWNFLDWVSDWDTGIPPGALNGSNAALNWHLVYAYKLAIDLESEIGDPELVNLWKHRAKELSMAITHAFWDHEKAVFADDMSQTHYSEHSQILALLSGFLAETKYQNVLSGLINSKELSKTTYYFKHYLFEVYRENSRADKIFETLEEWNIHFDLGLKTTLEEPEPSRSDCHGWSSHPLYHTYASILGIRPGSMAYKTVEIRPLLYNLGKVNATVIHPRGKINVRFEKNENTLNAHIFIPEDVTGSLFVANKIYPLESGHNAFTNVPFTQEKTG